MLTHHDDHRRDIRTFTTSRRIDATPGYLARALRYPSLFPPSVVDAQRPPPVAIDLDLTPDGCAALTLHSPCGDISERRPLRTRHTSTGRLTAESGDGTSIRDTDKTPALALTVDLSPHLQPGPAIATRITLTFHFVREPWWPHDTADALGSLADIWLRRLEEQGHATA